MPRTRNRHSYGEVPAEQILKATYPCKRAGTPKTSKRRLPKSFFLRSSVFQYNVVTQVVTRSSQTARTSFLLRKPEYHLRSSCSHACKLHIVYAKSQTVTISQWWTPNTIHLFWPNSFVSELSPLPGRVHVPPLFSEEVRRHLKWPR